MSTEQLRDVPGMETRYAVTRDGRVWSHATQSWRRPYLTRQGYARLSLSLEGGDAHYSVHRMVALAWLPNPNSLPCVNHIDGDKRNNADTNLEWCTKAHDVQHAWDSGLRKVTDRMRQATRENGLSASRGWAKLDVEKAGEIRSLCASGLSQRKVAARYGVSRESIRDVINGRNYRPAAE